MLKLRTTHLLFFLASILIHFNLHANPNPVFSSLSLDFGESFENTPKTKNLLISNSGDMAYIITNITSSDAQFTENISFAIVNPGDTLVVPIVFTAPSIGNFSGQLLIESPFDTTVIEMTGSGIISAMVSWSPDSISITLPSGSRDTVIINLQNIGGSNLTYSVAIENTVGGGFSFKEDFETPDQQFVTSNGNHTIALLLDEDAPGGNYVVELTGGGNLDPIEGVWTNQFNPTKFTRISYWFKADSISGAVNNVFRGWYYSGIVLNNWFDASQNIYTFNVLYASPVTTPCTPNEWHQVVIDLNYETSIASIRLDGVVVSNNISFSAWNAITQFQISNWFSATSYFDDIRATTSFDLSNNLHLGIDNGSISTGQSTDLALEMNAQWLAPGLYEGEVIVQNNSSNHPTISIPFNMTVTAGAQLIWPTDTIDLDTIYVAASVEKAFPLYNFGSDSLLLIAATAGDPQIEIHPASGIIGGFDSLHLMLTILASQPGPILVPIQLQSTAGNGQIWVKAQVIHRPIAHITPDSINVILMQDQDSTIHLQLSNNGLTDLNFQLNNSFESINQNLKILAYQTVGEYPQAINLLRNAGMQVTTTTDLNSFPPGGLDQFDLILFSREDNNDYWYSEELNNYVSNGGKVLFLGRQYNDILQFTGLFPDPHLFYQVYDSTLQITEVDHPIFRDVEMPLRFSPYVQAVTLALPDIHTIVGLNDQRASVIATRPLGLGCSMYLGYDYVSSNVQSERILFNSVQWLTNYQFPDWLDSNVANGILPAQTSSDIEWLISTDSLAAGTYTSKVTFTTNDPLRQKLPVYIKLTVVAPPKAAFSTSKTYTCDSAIEFINTTLNNATTYHWDFGDGTTSTEAEPTHTYTADGQYSVQLIACNNLGCDTLFVPDLIKVNLSGMFCDTLLLSPYFNQVVQTMSCSGILYDSGGPEGSYFNQQYSAARIITEPGKRIRLLFNKLSTESCCDLIQVFDGPSPASTQLFNHSGTVSDTVVIESSLNELYISFLSNESNALDGFECSWQCGVEFPIIAKFEANEFYCINTYNFVNKTLGSSNQYWDFGDGTYSTLESPVHTYEATGNYTVTLWAWNGSDTSVVSKIITISQVDFFADIAAPTFSQVGVPVTFSATSPFPIHTITWDINSIGTFPVTCVVYGTNGCFERYQDSIRVGISGVQSPMATAYQLTVAPNPVKDVIQYQLKGTDLVPYIAEIHNIDGRVVLQLPEQRAAQGTLPCSELPNGIYQLVLRTKSGPIWVSRFMKI
jgi:PKD repeat protein